MYTVIDKICWLDPDYNLIDEDRWLMVKYSTFEKALKAILEREKSSSAWKRYLQIPHFRKTANGGLFGFYYVPKDIVLKNEDGFVDSLHDIHEWVMDDWEKPRHYTCYEIIDMNELPVDGDITYNYIYE